MNRTIKMFATRTYMHLCCLLHKTKKKVVFESFGGKQYSDNPRAVSEKLHEKYPDYEIVWGMNDTENLPYIMPGYVRVVKRSSFRFYRELAEASGYVSNCSFSRNLYKNKNCVYVQTWHGDRGFKKIAYDMWPDADHIKNGSDKDYADLYVAGSEFGKRLCKTAFRYFGGVMESGSPRNDKLIEDDGEKRRRIKEALQIENDVKVLLYAPTFKDNSDGKQKVDVNLNEVMEHLRAKGEKWICAVRSHSVSDGLEIKDKGIIDLSDYPDMADLLLIADMLLTDYSSSAGDYVLRDKAVILVQFNRTEFENNIRELYFRIEDSGYITASNQQELNRIIDTYTNEDYAESCRKVKAFYGVKETGRSAEDVCDMINEKYRVLSERRENNG